MQQNKNSGFTIVELLIVIIVIAILAAISTVLFTGVQQRSKTSASLSTASQVKKKATLWAATQGSYPDLAQLRTNSLAPTDINTPGGEDGPREAKLDKSTMADGAEINEVRAENGNVVEYAPCWDGTKHSGARIFYYDFKAGRTQSIVGTCS